MKPNQTQYHTYTEDRDLRLIGAPTGRWSSIGGVNTQKFENFPRDPRSTEAREVFLPAINWFFEANFGQG